MKPVLVLTAVPEEAAPLEALLHKKSRLQVSGLSLVKGEIGSREICLLVSGPGVLNTAAKLSALLCGFRPEYILELGCAGMYPQSGLAMGSLALASQELDLHLGLESSTPLPHPLPFSLMDPPQKRPGLYEADARLTAMALSILKEKGFPFLPCGPFVTVSTITTRETTALAIERETGALMENMEGAAAFHTAALHTVPILELRSVSNPAGSRKKEDWDLETAFIRGAEGALCLIRAGIHPR